MQIKNTLLKWLFSYRRMFIGTNFYLIFCMQNTHSKSVFYNQN